MRMRSNSVHLRFVFLPVVLLLLLKYVRADTVSSSRSSVIVDSQTENSQSSTGYYREDNDVMDRRYINYICHEIDLRHSSEST